jgi:hypothetical protein
MPIGIIGTAAWALIIEAKEARQSEMPDATPPVHLETKEECESIERAINSKAWQAGVEDRLSAKCYEIEYIDPAQFAPKP